MLRVTGGRPGHICTVISTRMLRERARSVPGTRIGLIVPSSNTTVESEFYRLAPKGFTVHAARMGIREVTIAALARMERDAEAAAMLLSDAEVDVICYACTSGSFYRGMKHEHELAARLSDRSGAPVVTTSHAVISALNVLRAKRIAVCTPYTRQVNEKLARFFAENGFVVADLRGLGMVQNTEIGRQPPEVAYDLVRRAETGLVDAVFLSCTNLRTVEIIGRLESEAGIPVTSSNVATFWYAVRTLGYRKRIEGLGRLLSNARLAPSKQ